MPFSLPVYRVRCQSDFSEPGAILNRLTGEAVRIPKASDVRFEVGVFSGLRGGIPFAAAQVASQTGWSSLEVSLEAAHGVFLSKSSSSFSTLTFATWNDDSAQHCTIDFTDTEMNVAPGKYSLCLTVETATLRFPVGTATIHVFTP